MPLPGVASLVFAAVAEPAVVVDATVASARDDGLSAALAAFVVE
jgi:hypothetical protein